jgi:hypothetical protein
MGQCDKGEDNELERAVRFELTITGFAVQCLWPAWRRAREVGPQMNTDLLRSEKAIRYQTVFLSVLICVHLWLIFLERKERFELSSRVWKTRMFPATSHPQIISD